MLKNKKFFFVLLVIVFSFVGISFVQAESNSTDQPIIKTSKTDNGSSINIVFPDNYSGEVRTTFDGKSFKTEAKKYTESEIKKMNDTIIEQNKAWQKYFEAQMKIWEEQQKYFDSIFKNFWLF